MSESFKRVVLAYSGGLDTSVILKWLQVTYGCEVVTFTADLGQGEEIEPARLRFVVHSRFVGDLFTEDSLTIALHDRIDAGSIGDAVLVDVGSDVSGFREKLASALDCSDALGI